MIRFVLGTLALFGAAFFAFFLEGGKLLSFFLPTPLMIVVCVPLFAVLAVWSLKDWGRAWRDAFLSGGGARASSAAASAKLWDFYEKSCYIAGIVGFILGLNIILQNGGGIERGEILKPLAIDCVAPILAILFAMVARILRARVERNNS